MNALKWILVLTIAIAAGCSSKDHSNDAVNKLSEKEVDTLSAEHSKFENSSDPPFTADTRYAAGQLAASRGDHQTAIQQFKAGLEIDPRHRATLFELGVLYTQLKMFPEAIQTFQKYVEVTKGDGEALSNLGFCYELAGKQAEAEQTYQKGIAAAHGADVAHINYGLMLTRNGRTDEAITQLSAVLRPAEVHYNIGSVYEQQGKKDQARDEYSKALQLDPNLRDAKARLKGLH